MEIQKQQYLQFYNQHNNQQNTVQNNNYTQDQIYSQFLAHWNKEIVRLGYIPSNMCLRPIKQDEKLWKCYDCSHDQEVVCLCTECFIRGNHQGHRVQFYHKSTTEATCDCGDISQPYKINCESHKKDDGISNKDIEGMIDNQFAQDMSQLINMKLVKIFTVIDKNWDSSFQIQSARVEMENLIGFLTSMLKNNRPIAYLIGHIFSQKITSFNTHHNCVQMDNIQENWAVSCDINQLCICTIQENFFKYRIYFEKFGTVNGQQIEQSLSDIFKLCMVNENYKQHLVVNYIKHYNYLYFKSTEQSGFWQLYAQFFSNDSMKEVLSSPVFYTYFQNHFTKTIKKIQYDYNKSDIDVWQQQWNLVNYMFDHPLIFELWEKDISTLNLCVSYMESISQSVNHYYNDLDQEHTQMTLDAYNMDLFNTIIVRIKKIEEKQKKVDLIKYLLFRAYKIYVSVQSQFRPPLQVYKSQTHLQPHSGDSFQIEEEIPSEDNSTQVSGSNSTGSTCDGQNMNHKDFRYWFINGARICGILMFNLIDLTGRCHAQMEFETLFNYYNINPQVRNKFLCDLVKTFSRSLLFNKIKDMCSEPMLAAQNGNTNQDYDKSLQQRYKSNKLLQYDRDLLSLQSLIHLMQPELFMQSLVQEYQMDMELLDNYQNLPRIQQYTVMYFVELIAIMQMDTTAMINIMTIQEDTNNMEYKTLLKNFIVHSYLWQSKVDFKSIQECLYVFGLTVDVKIEDVLLMVTELSNGQFVLTQCRDEKKIHDPYQFIRYCKNMGNSMCRLTSLAQKHPEYDTVLGNGEDYLDVIPFFKNMTPRFFVGNQFLLKVCMKLLQMEGNLQCQDRVFKYIQTHAMKVVYTGLHRAYLCGLILQTVEKEFGRNLVLQKGILANISSGHFFQNTIERFKGRVKYLHTIEKKYTSTEEGCCLHLCENDEKPNKEQTQCEIQDRKQKMEMMKQKKMERMQKKKEKFITQNEEQLLTCNFGEIDLTGKNTEDLQEYKCQRKDPIYKLKPHCNQCYRMCGEERENLIQQVKRDPVCQKKLMQSQCEIICFPAFVASDNLRNFYYGNTQVQRNSQQFTIINCNHTVHKMCDDMGWRNNNCPISALSQNKNKAQYESLCRECQGLKNIYIPIIEYYVRAKNDFDTLNGMELSECFQEQQRMNKNLIYDLLFTKQQLVQNTQEYAGQNQNYHIDKYPSMVFESSEFLINLAKIVNKDMNSYDYSWAIFVFKDLIEFLLENLFAVHFRIFVERGKDTLLYNLMLQFRMILIACGDLKMHYSKDIGFSVELQKYYLSNVANLLEINQTKFVKQVAEKFSQKRFDLDQEFIQFTSNLTIFMGDKSEEDYFNVLKMYGKKYINNINVLFIFLTIKFHKQKLQEQQHQIEQQNFTLEQEVNFQNKYVTIEDFKQAVTCDYYKAIVQGYALPYYRLVTGTFWSLFSHEFTFDTKMYTEIHLEFVKMELFFGHNILYNVLEIVEHAEYGMLQELNMLCKNDWQEFLVKNPQQKFQIQNQIENIKEDFLTFHKTHFYNKCQQCYDFPNVTDQDLYKCLVCGFQLCSQKCSEGDKFQSNLFKHAIQCHQGRTIYMRLQHGTLFLMDEEKCIQLKIDLFNNKIGQGFVNEPNVDWKQYKANQNVLRYLNQLLLERKINQEIRQKLANEKEQLELFSLIPFEDGDNQYGPL